MFIRLSTLDMLIFCKLGYPIVFSFFRPFWCFLFSLFSFTINNFASKTVLKIGSRKIILLWFKIGKIHWMQYLYVTVRFTIALLLWFIWYIFFCLIFSEFSLLVQLYFSYRLLPRKCALQSFDPKYLRNCYRPR